MKNDLKQIGSWKIHKPELVVKGGLVFDAYKLPHLNELWKESERQLKKAMPTLNTDDFFHQEELTKPGEKVWYSFRYYTPANNRELIQTNKQEKN